MAVFRNYSSLYASPLAPLDSVFRLILIDLFVLCSVHDICTYVGLSTKSNQLTLNDCTACCQVDPQPKVEG